MADGEVRIKVTADAAQATAAIDKLKGAATGIGKAAVAGGAAVVGAVGAIGAAALGAYASYEQLVGGVDTLFKDSSKTVQAYAAQAYKTAGVSANRYMEQATAFSASLIQNLGGDTEAAARYADLAITDMSDNANKMGTSIDSIQQTYQSLMRGNYAMLDNLKLGYGGTKSELERLVKDAEKLTGQALDPAKFSDVITAIHAVQESLGITGTTAKEAAETIEGSVNTMRASWDNWLAGLGNPDADMSALTDQLLESVGNVAKNVAPRVAQIGRAIVENLPAALSGVGEVLAPVLSEALAAAWGVAAKGLEGLGISLPEIDASQVNEAFQRTVDAVRLLLSDPAAFLQQGADMVQSLASGAVAALPQLIDRGREMVSSIAGGVREAVPQLMEQGLQLLTTLSQGFLEGLPALAEMGGQLVLSIVQGVMDGLPQLIEQGPQIVSNIANGITEAAETLLGVGLQILLAIAQGLVEAIPTLLANIPAILQAVWDAIVAFQWHSAGMGIVTKLGDGIASIGTTIPTKLGEFLTQASQKVAQFAADIASKGLRAGADFLLNIAVNFSQAPGKVAGWVSNMALSAASLVGDLGASAAKAGNGFLSSLSSGLSSAVSFVSGIPGRILGALGSVGSLLWNAGASIINGLYNGIRDTIGKVFDFVSGIAGKIASLKGPLPYDRKLLIPAGEAIAGGLLRGLKDGMAGVYGYMRDVTAGIDGWGAGLSLQPNLAYTGAGGTQTVYSFQIGGMEFGAGDDKLARAASEFAYEAARAYGRGV